MKHAVVGHLLIALLYCVCDYGVNVFELLPGGKVLLVYVRDVVS